MRRDPVPGGRPVMGLRRFIRDRCIAPDHTGTVGLQADTVYRLLGNRRRRVLLTTLDEHSDAVTVSELARTVGAAETGAEPFALETQAYERFYVSVYQSHLPTLAQADVVEWERERGVVVGTDLVGPLAEIVREIDDRTVSHDQP